MHPKRIATMNMFYVVDGDYENGYGQEDYETGYGQDAGSENGY
jgi:hypothetical protein